jgi:hypothetical protein
MERASAEGDELIEQTQSVTHAAFGGARHERECGRFEFELLGGRNELQAFADQIRRKTLETELQTARQHRDR